MLTKEFITSWLNSPQQIADSAALEAFIQKHPYFLPARYMKAAGMDGRHALEASHSYAAHHLLFREKLGVIPAKNTIVATEIPAPESAVIPDYAPSFQPVFTEDYFRHQGMMVEDKLPEIKDQAQLPEDPKSLMVMMSFTDWLMHYKTKAEQEAEENDSRRALKTMWQKEKLAAALEDDGEDDEIPEEVFKMAVDSIAKEDGLISESLAEILVKQRKWSKAIEMYRRLSAKNPAKSTYFAAQIESLQKLNTEQ